MYSFWKDKVNIWTVVLIGLSLLYLSWHLGRFYEYTHPEFSDCKTELRDPVTIGDNKYVVVGTMCNGFWIDGTGVKK